MGLNFVMVIIHEGMMAIGNMMPLKQAMTCNKDQLNPPAARSVFTKLERNAISPVKKTVFESKINARNKIEFVLMPKRAVANSQERSELAINTTAQARLFPSST